LISKSIDRLNAAIRIGRMIANAKNRQLPEGVACFHLSHPCSINSYASTMKEIKYFP
jgi:hypothetical protein